MRRCLIVIALLALTGTGRAALPERGGSAVPAKAALLNDVDQLRSGLPDRADLAAEDAVRAAEGAPFRFALPLDVSLIPGRAGTWETLPDGRRLWRLRVTVPGALSLNLGFLRYRLPGSGRLALYPVDRPADGLVFDAADNADHGELWTPVLLTDDLVVELVVDAAERGLVDLELGRVGRGYRLFGEDRADKAGACNIDVVCPEGDDWRTEIAAVGRFVFGGSKICTGTLLNNTNLDRLPLFLSAAHCTDGVSGNSVVVYWNFESPNCGDQGGGDLDDVQSGGTVRAQWGDPDDLVPIATSDLLLVELDDVPPPAYAVAYAGWNRQEAPPSSAVCIHHPTGDEKSISIENDPVTVTSYVGDVSPGDGNHLRVEDWDLGTTEVGSSGSGLFGPDHRLVGTLRGGFAACGNDEADWYGRLVTSWEGGGTPATRLKDWLDPGDTGDLSVRSYDPGRAVMDVAPTDGSAWSGPPGGPFTPGVAQYGVTSTGGVSVTWSAEPTVPWLAVSNTGGDLGPGFSSPVAVTPSAAANDLAPGRYSGQVHFVNETSGLGNLTVTIELVVYSLSPRITNIIPNPAWGEMNIEYTLGRATDVHVRFYDVRGRMVADLGTHAGHEGLNTYPWWGRDQDGRSLPGGVYFVELEGLGQLDRRRLVRTH